MTRPLTLVQPLPPWDGYDAMLCEDVRSWMPDAHPAGPGRWTFELSVGGVSRPVVAKIGSPWRTPDGLMRAIAWQPAPLESDLLPLERMLPAFDGELFLVGDDRLPSLVLLGEVEAPLGAVGDAIGVAMLHRLAQRGADAFVARIARHMAAEREDRVGTSR